MAPYETNDGGRRMEAWLRWRFSTNVPDMSYMLFCLHHTLPFISFLSGLDWLWFRNLALGFLAGYIAAATLLSLCVFASRRVLGIEIPFFLFFGDSFFFLFWKFE